MLLGKIFQPFVEKRPVCVLARGILERILDPDHLDTVFARTAEQQYTGTLLFSTLVDLMSQVVLGVQPSVHAAYQAQAERLTVSDQAIYNKLQHVEPAVSAALVRDAAQQVEPVIRQLRATLPSWLPGFRIKIVDGNHLAGTDHRLAELRTTWAAALPGKALVVLDQSTMTASEVFLTEDGHAQERTLLDAVVARVAEQDLWIGDRNFCTLGFMFGIAGRGGRFLLRQHGTVKGQLLGRRKAKGRCATGRVFEQRLRLRHPDGTVLLVRRVTIVLDKPTRDGDTEIHVLTNLTARQASAAKVADLYRQRWTIEAAFLEIAQTLACEVNTLGYPKAALFAFCLALQAYNAVALLKAALRAAHGHPKVSAEVSGYYLALEIQQTYEGMMIAIPEKHWGVFRRFSLRELAAVLKEIASQASLRRYRKHPRGPKKKPPRRSAYKNGAHVSTAKLLPERNGRK